MSAAGSQGNDPPPPSPPTLARTQTSMDIAGILARGELLAGRYRVSVLLGVGGMGMVYRAHDEELDVDVAVKVLRPDLSESRNFRERFRREVILARQVSHPNVVRIHDIGQHGKVFFLTMDFVAGRSLRDVLNDDGPFPPERAISITGQLAEALATAHEHGVVHRDLKPENVLVTENDKPFITDFGVARSLECGGLTQSGAVMGTLDYLSPEQARGDEVDGRSDLYTLGLMLFEMLSGQRPSRRGSQAEVLAHRMAGRLPDIDALAASTPPSLRRVLRQMLESDPVRRFQSARDLLAALGGTPTQAPSLLLMAGGLERPWWRRTAIYALAGAALVAAVWLMVRKRQPETVGGVAAIDATPRHAVAVLPLRDETGRPEMAWTSKGLAERLSRILADHPRLQVTDSLSVFRVLDDLGHAGTPLSRATLRELAALLEVDRLVVGRLRPMADELRLELELLDAAGTVLDNLATQRQVGELYAALDDLGKDLSRELEAVSRAEAGGERPPPSPEAARAYSLGVERLAGGDLPGATSNLEEAVAADAGFAEAWVRLAEVYRAQGRTDRARQAADQAVATAGTHGGRIAFEARARRALLHGELETAQGLFEELVERFPNDVESRLALAEAYGDSGRIDRALATLEMMRERNPNHPRVWFLLAKFAILSGDNRRAVDEYLVRALVLYNKMGSEPGRGDVLNAFGLAYERLGKVEEALDNYRKAVQIRERIGDRRGLASSLRNLAAVHLMQGDEAAARTQLERAHALYEELGDRAGIAAIYEIYGVLDEDQGRFREALEHYRRALKLRTEIGDQFFMGNSLDNVGFAYYMLGEYDNAMVYWSQALELRQSTGDRHGAVKARQNIGLLQLTQGDWNGASRSFLGSLEESRALEMQSAIAIARGHLGRLAQLQGRYHAAFTAYAQCLEILAGLDDLRGLVEFTLFDADARLEVGEIEAAAERLARVKEWLERAPNQEQLAHLWILEGELARQRGRLVEARQRFVAARGQADAIHHAEKLLRARLELIDTGLSAGNVETALADLEKLIRQLDLLGHAELRLRAAELRARVQLAAGRAEGARATLEAAQQLLQSVGAYAGAYRLHRLSALAAPDPATAAAAWQAAREEVERLLDHVEGEPRESFLQLPEVHDIVERNASDGNSNEREPARDAA